MSALPERFARYVAQLAEPGARGAPGRYPALTSRPWHDPSTFALVRDLEANAATVLRELRGLSGEAFAPEREPIARRGRWDVAFFYERGRPHERMRALCPATFALLDGAHIVRGPSGLAYVSRLSAASHVAPHRGPTNVRLRCHFGVDVPDECGLSVGDESRTWTEGRCLVFDDSFVHEAWNRDVRDRIVLIVDVWHPDLSASEVRLLEGLDAYVATQATTLARYYEKNRADGPPT